MSQRKAVTQKKAVAYSRATRSEKTRILNELVDLTGWHRDHARAALIGAGTLKILKPRKPRTPKYGSQVIVCLTTCWTLSVPLLARDWHLAQITDPDQDLG